MVVKADITIDIDKQVGNLQNLTNIYNARVGDSNTPLTVLWQKNGMALNLKGLHAFIAGKVGDGSYNAETDKVDFPVGTPVVKYEDDGSGTLDDGQSGLTTLLIPKQMWVKTGLFAGYIGLKDENGLVFTSKDIFFKILGNVLDAGVEINYFISDFDKALAKAKGDTQQAIEDARTAYESETKNAHDSLDALNSQIQANRDEQANLIQRLAGTEQQIEVNDIVKTSAFNAGMDQEKTARTNVDNDILQKFSNLLTSTSGKETNSAPEIKDARLGSSLVRGLSYDTLGNGIRDQVNKLFELLISNEDVQNGRISRMNYSDLVDRFDLLSNLLYDSSQLYEEPLLDIDEAQIEAENGDLISAETPGLKTDTTLSQLNVPADAYIVGQALKKLQASSLDAPTACEATCVAGACGCTMSFSGTFSAISGSACLIS